MLHNNWRTRRQALQAILTLPGGLHRRDREGLLAMTATDRAMCTEAEDRIRELEEAVELVLGHLPSGPTLSAFGIAREDCALVHMDYFLDIEIAANELAEALGKVRGSDSATILREFGRRASKCDGPCCASPDEARAAREKHIASYTNVRQWIEAPELPPASDENCNDEEGNDAC